MKNWEYGPVWSDAGCRENWHYDGPRTRSRSSTTMTVAGQRRIQEWHRWSSETKQGPKRTTKPGPRWESNPARWTAEQRQRLALYSKLGRGLHTSAPGTGRVYSVR